MSTDPNSGIAYLTMYDSAGGQLTDGAQFSGVLIAPDEILTVAHGVTEKNGGLRNYGTAYLGFDGGKLSGGDQIDGVHVIDNTHSTATQGDAAVSTDYAVVHLSTPITTAQTFALGLGQVGSYHTSGYPAVDEGVQITVDQTLTQGIMPGELLGQPLVPGGDAFGASGGPVWSDGTTPTVVGVAVGSTSTTGAFKGLTATDITQIRTWVYSDDAGQPWGSAFAPAPATPQPAPTPPPSTSPVPVGRLDQLASLLRTASGAETAPKALMSNDVATALTMAANRGYNGTDIPDAAYETAAILSRTSWTPRKAIAYLAGLMVGEAGVARGGVLTIIANTFGLSVGMSLDPVIMAGYADDRSFGSITMSAPVATAAGDGWTAQALAAALGHPGAMGTSHGSAALASPAEVSVAALQAGQGAHHRIS